VAGETLALMQNMVEEGEVDALVPERVWQELARGLMEAHPSRMLAVLRDCGALARIMPELDAAWGDGSGHRCPHDAGDRRRRRAATRWRCASPPSCRIPARTAPSIHAACKRLKVPNDCRDLALMTAREHEHVARAFELGADTIVALFERCDGFRKPERFADMLLASACDARGRGRCSAMPGMRGPPSTTCSGRSCVAASSSVPSTAASARAAATSGSTPRTPDPGCRGQAYKVIKFACDITAQGACQRARRPRQRDRQIAGGRRIRHGGPAAQRQ
jgi:hypothetical protein